MIMTSIARYTALVGFFCATPLAFSQKAEVAQRFNATYRALKSVQCSFTRDGGGKGTLLAIKGKGYDINLGDRRLVSNGSVVWNITAATKTVIINAVQANSQDVGIEQMFFTLMAIYVPTTLKQSGTTTTLRLRPPSATAVVGGIEQADVTVNKSLQVTRIQAYDGNTTTSWSITSMRLNRASAATFSYSVPNGWHIVDLR
jgi:outer membrane lipoprotein-sorting protein